MKLNGPNDGDGDGGDGDGDGDGGGGGGGDGHPVWSSSHFMTLGAHLFFKLILMQPCCARSWPLLMLMPRIRALPEVLPLRAFMLCSFIRLFVRSHEHSPRM